MFDVSGIDVLIDLLPEHVDECCKSYMLNNSGNYGRSENYSSEVSAVMHNVNAVLNDDTFSKLLEEKALRGKFGMSIGSVNVGKESEPKNVTASKYGYPRGIDHKRVA